jgi:hypothetical protein
MSAFALLLAALAADPAAPADLAAPSETTTQPAPAPETAPAPAAPAPEKPAEPVAQPVAQSAPAPVPAVAPAAPQKPKELWEGLSSYFRPSILAQAWFFMDHSAPLTCVDPNCLASWSSTFRIRRAELGFTGAAFGDHLQYKVTIDPARAPELKNLTVSITGGAKGESVSVKQPTTNPFSSSGTGVLNDFYLTYVTDYLDVTAGQFRIPVSYEGYNGSNKLLMPERDYVVRAYGDRRDVGVRLGKIFKHFGFGAFLFNGAGQNSVEDVGRNSKDLAFRLEAYPIEGMLIAAVWYGSVGLRSDAGAKDRWEGDFRYENGPYLIQAEFIRAQDKNTKLQWVQSYGFYVALAYTLLEKCQFAVRIGHYDPVLGAGSDVPTSREANMYELGVNYFFVKHEVKLQLSYSLFDWANIPYQHQVVLSSQFNY